jgi:hypothetical protein
VPVCPASTPLGDGFYLGLSSLNFSWGEKNLRRIRCFFCEQKEPKKLFIYFLPLACSLSRALSKWQRNATFFY